MSLSMPPSAQASSGATPASTYQIAVVAVIGSGVILFVIASVLYRRRQRRLLRALSARGIRSGDLPYMPRRRGRRGRDGVGLRGRREKDVMVAVPVLWEVVVGERVGDCEEGLALEVLEKAELDDKRDASKNQGSDEKTCARPNGDFHCNDEADLHKSEPADSDSSKGIPLEGDDDEEALWVPLAVALPFDPDFDQLIELPENMSTEDVPGMSRQSSILPPLVPHLPPPPPLSPHLSLPSPLLTNPPPPAYPRPSADAFADLAPPIPVLGPDVEVTILLAMPDERLCALDFQLEECSAPFEIPTAQSESQLRGQYHLPSGEIPELVLATACIPVRLGWVTGDDEQLSEQLSDWGGPGYGSNDGPGGAGQDAQHHRGSKMG